MKIVNDGYRCISDKSKVCVEFTLRPSGHILKLAGASVEECQDYINSLDFLPRDYTITFIKVL